MRIAVQRSGQGPDVVLFHGGMGSWKHWVRNIDALAARFTVHALDHPAYGDSPSLPRETTGPEYLDLMYGIMGEMFPGETLECTQDTLIGVARGRIAQVELLDVTLWHRGIGVQVRPHGFTPTGISNATLRKSSIASFR